MIPSLFDTDRENLIEKLDRAINEGEITEHEASEELKWFDNQANAEM